MKAYLDQTTITLKPEKGDSIVFSAGAAICGIISPSPYGLLKGSPAKANTLLDTLYENRSDSAAEQMSLLSGKTFSVSFEATDGKLLPAVEVKTVEDLMLLELLVTRQNGKPLKKCEHCGGYFFPTGRSDALYCDRVGEDGFSCKKIGAHRQYRKNSRANDVKALYDKMTKHNRYLKNAGKLSERDYDRWMASVSESYAAFKAGTLSERRLMAELLEEIGTKRNTRSISDYLL